MKIKILNIVFFFLIACSTKQNKQNRPQTYENELAQVVVDSKDSITYYKIISIIQNSKEPFSYLQDKNWQQYESMGDSDTALALFAYRIINQMDTTFDGEEEHIRLYDESEKVKKIMLGLFKADSSIDKILPQLDTLNKKFRKFAEITVQKDIKQLGESDGPLGEFIDNLKIRK